MSDDKPTHLSPEMKARFEHLDQIAKETAESEAKLKASYHHSNEQDAKDDKARVEASAEQERKKANQLDPLELIRQLSKMREEGVSDEIIRAALDEVLGDRLTGKPRRPLRRVLKSEGMIRMLSPDEMNKHYTNLVYPPKGEESDSQMDERVRLILERIEQTKDLKIEVKKPTVKNYLYRAAYFVLRYPVNFVINFVTAYRTAKYQTKHNAYRTSSFNHED